jgi:hypothetical protein
MSDIISNPHVEKDMTDKFICVIYFQDRNEADVRINGIDPLVIWEILGYHAFGESVIPIILDRLIFNNEVRGFITYNQKTKKVLLTETGRQWADENCRTRAGVIG